MAEITLKGILLSLLIAAVFAYVGVTVLAGQETAYSVTLADNSTSNYAVIEAQSAQISDDMNQVSAWLQDLTSGSVLTFVFAMPDNVAKILSLFVQVPNLMNTVFTATLAVFGIPVFVTQIFEVMMIVVVLLILVAIWARS